MHTEDSLERLTMMQKVGPEARLWDLMLTSLDQVKCNI